MNLATQKQLSALLNVNFITPANEPGVKSLLDELANEFGLFIDSNNPSSFTYRLEGIMGQHHVVYSLGGFKITLSPVEEGLSLAIKAAKPTYLGLFEPLLYEEPVFNGSFEKSYAQLCNKVNQTLLAQFERSTKTNQHVIRVVNEHTSILGIGHCSGGSIGFSDTDSFRASFYEARHLMLEHAKTTGMEYELFKQPGYDARPFFELSAKYEFAPKVTEGKFLTKSVEYHIVENGRVRTFEIVDDLMLGDSIMVKAVREVNGKHTFEKGPCATWPEYIEHYINRTRHLSQPDALCI